MKPLDEHFEQLRKDIDELTNDWPLDRTQWAEHSDLQSAVTFLEQGYKRLELLERKT